MSMKIVQHNTKETIKSAVKSYVDFLSPTYGPAGKKVLIATGYSHQAVDDGHMASKEFELENEFQNAVVQYIKETTAKTNDRVGDGTTTSAVLMGALVEKIMALSEDEFLGKNPKECVVEVEKALKEAVDHIKNASKSIETPEELYAIAYNSFNNEVLAKLISETIYKIGKDGVIAIEDSNGMEASVDIVQGLEVTKGFVSPYFVNTEKGESTLSNPSILLINKRLDSLTSVVPILKGIAQSERKDVLIMAEGFADEVVNNLILNKLRGAFNPLLVETPGFGDNRIESLEDIAVVTGATIVDNKTGVTFENVKLGTCGKVVALKDKTTFIGSETTPYDLGVYISGLEGKLERATTEYEKDKLKRRIAALKGGIAVIRVGALTENEQKAIKAKVEDAVNATKVAFKDGVVKGAGLTYSEIETSSPILNEALKAPRKQLEANGKEFLDENVVDPTGVLIAALESAVSIASGLVTIGGIVTNKREKEKNADY